MKRFACLAAAIAISTAAPLFAGDSAAMQPDNTARNARDADGGTLLPTDQGSSDADVAITTRIRQAVVAQDDL